MESINKKQINGYRALFDPNYVPPKVIGRKKEIEQVSRFVNDNLITKCDKGVIERFGTSILIGGLKGIGKSTLISKVLNEKLNMKAFLMPVINLKIDCWEKDELELLIDLILKLGINLNTDLFYQFDLKQAWGVIFSYLRKRGKNRLYNLFLNNVESIQPKFFKKLSFNLKNLGLNLLATTNFRYSSIILDNMDLYLNLDVYELGDLYRIVDDRIELAFSERNAEAARYITDAVVEFDTARPGPCISILKRIYPNIHNNWLIDVNPEILQKCCTDALPDIQYSEFDIVELFSTSPVQLLIFLDNITGFLLSTESLYATKKELEDL
ncbi:MAG: hypothetical protein ACXQS8_03465 [Candidatus Helarchaeales archaeon]